MRETSIAAVVVALALAGCDAPQKQSLEGAAVPAASVTGDAPAASAPHRTAGPLDSAGGVVRVTQGPDGSIKVQGAPELSGDARSCAAFKACCSEANGPSGLACALAPSAAKGDCREALVAIRSVLADQAIPYPPGCDAPPPATTAVP